MSCCIPSRKGSLAVAILYLAGNIIALVSITIWVIYSLVWAYQRQDVELSYSHRWPRTVTDAWHLFYWLLGLYGYSCISIPINSLMVHAIRKNQRKRMLPWVVWYGIVTSLAAFAWLVGAVFVFRGPYTDFWLLRVIYITLPSSVVLVVMSVCYACVVSYYRKSVSSDHYAMQAVPATRADEV